MHEECGQPVMKLTSLKAKYLKGLRKCQWLKNHKQKRDSQIMSEFQKENDELMHYIFCECHNKSQIL